MTLQHFLRDGDKSENLKNLYATATAHHHKRRTMIPKNPITLWINGALTDSALRDLAAKYLPAYDLVITSGYRTPAYNEKIKGAQDSAHLYNLARDFQLKNRASGKIASDEDLKKLFDQYIAPNWEGYKLFEPKTDTSSGAWIHLNLDRVISDNTKFLAMAAGALTAAWTAQKIFSYIRQIKSN